MRWWLGSVFLMAGLLACGGSLLAYPYTSMGVGPDYLRPGVAEISRNLAFTSLALLIVAGVLVLGDAANRNGWPAMIFVTLLILVGLGDIARLVWLFRSVL